MKKFFSILLLSVYMFSFTEMHQLLKLPILIEHFVEHKSLSGALTFFEFLELHYTSETDHDDHDHELPFKDFDHCVMVQTMVIPSFKIELTEAPIFNTKVVYTTFYKQSIPSSHLSEIWQPPRLS